MNAHDRALELAVARVDFSLTESEREALHRHLDACAQCRDDAEGVAEDARRLTSRPVHRLAPERSAAMRLSLERPRRRMSPAMVLVAAALLLVLGIATAAVGAEIVRRLEEPRLAVLPVPSVAIVSPAPSAGPAASPFVPTAWSLTDAGTLAPGLSFAPAAVASSELGWIAIGGRNCVKTGIRDEISMYACASAAARSADGRAWTASGTVPYATNYAGPTSGPEAGIVGVAAGPEGFVAVGFARDGKAQPVMAIPDGAAWWSADGATWESHPARCRRSPLGGLPRAGPLADRRRDLPRRGTDRRDLDLGGRPDLDADRGCGHVRRRRLCRHDGGSRVRADREPRLEWRHAGRGRPGLRGFRSAVRGGRLDVG